MFMVSIIDRINEDNQEAEYKEEEWIRNLALSIPSSIGNVSNDRVVWASVNGCVYQKCKEKDFARIYYDPSNPSRFIIEGE